MEKEKEYLQHIGEHDVGLAGRVGTLALANFVTSIERFIPMGTENIPADGPAIIAANHISYADTLMLNGYLLRNHRQPHIIVTDGLLNIPVVGSFLRSGHTIPVKRGEGAAANLPALDTAVKVLDRGDMVVIYPEGGAARGEDRWPIKAKSGLGYIALNSGAPVIPVAQWGSQEIMWRDENRKHRFARWPFGKNIIVNAGKPMTFSREQFPDMEKNQQNQAVSNAVMSAVTEQLAFIRGEEPKGYYAKPSAE